MFKVAERIKYLCEQKKINSIYELAKISGVRQSTLQNIVSGEISNPRTDTIERICVGFGITIAEFFAEDTSQPVKEPGCTYDDKIKNLPKKDRQIIDTIIEINKPTGETSTAVGK